ncbi:nucleosomal histone kinase 1-like [Contarinia nasturtii]|uniref:nucleosomal histone kinase 1-like n=1 Tax=Contarinia nasturtii TaxID=265458 RepID=UPI0012D48AF8|nr:nucleosomal histone kinase 1-like [Contarinia nasturtii]
MQFKIDTVIDTINNKWSIVKNGNFSDCYYAQKDNSNLVGENYPYIAKIVDIYEYIHRYKYVLGNLKASDLRLGTNENDKQQVYLIRFDFVSHLMTRSLKSNKTKMHKGCIRLISRDAHQGVLTLRGDMENLAFNLLEWAGGALPWMNCLNEADKVQRSKDKLMSRTNIDLHRCFPNEICPETIRKFFEHIGECGLTELPSYEKYRKCFLGIRSQSRSETISVKKTHNLRKRRVPENTDAKMSDNQQASKKIKVDNRQAVVKSVAPKFVPAKRDALVVGSPILAWMKSYSPWPARLISIDNANCIVYFYGDNNRTGKVPIDRIDLQNCNMN